MSAAVIYDNGRDGFLARSTSKPPSKFDSIEYLNIDASTPPGKSRRSPGVRQHNSSTARSTCSSNVSTPGSNATTTGAWSWGDGNNSCANTEDMTLATRSSWKAEVSGRRSKPMTAPSSTSKHRKKFFWGPKVALQGQEMDREVRSTNKGEPATFALALERCPSTVSTIRSLVPRAFPSPSTAGTHDDDTATLIAGLEPYIRTSITDRIHDGIYDTDTAHKSTLGGRVKRGEIRGPHICRHGSTSKVAEDLGRQQFLGPGHYDTSSGIDATSEAPKFLPLSRDKCSYDSYIRRGLGQTTCSAIGPGYYGWEPIPTAGLGPLAFSDVERWPLQPASKVTSNRGPWDDVKDAWGRGGYIESAVPRECKSYLPPEVLWYTNHLDIDHLGKESFATAMRRNPKRYAASFSNTQEPDWRVNGSPALGPGTYAVERAETLTFPAPQGGAGDADPARPSLPFRVRYTPFDTRHLASGYKTLKPRFSTPRTTLHASELPGRAPGAAANLGHTKPSPITAAERTAGEQIDSRGGGKKRLTPAAKAAAVAAAAAADPWAIGGRGSRFVRLERPSVLDPVRDGSRRRAAAATWRSLHHTYRGRGGLKS